MADVRYWHKADMASALQMSAFGGKADIAPAAQCPLMTQSGHSAYRLCDVPHSLPDRKVIGYDLA